MVDTSDEWIMSRIGIKTRHILKGEGLGTSYMTERAVKDLLEKTNTDPLDIEMVVCATVTPDMFFPSTANLTCYKTGMKNAFGRSVGRLQRFLICAQHGCEIYRDRNLQESRRHRSR